MDGKRLGDLIGTNSCFRLKVQHQKSGPFGSDKTSGLWQKFDMLSATSVCTALDEDCNAH